MQPRKARVQASYQNYQWEKQHWKGRENPHTGQDTEKLTLNRDTTKTCPRWHDNVLYCLSPQRIWVFDTKQVVFELCSLFLGQQGPATSAEVASQLLPALPAASTHPSATAGNSIHCSLCASGIPRLIVITTPFTPCKHRGSPKSLHFSETVTYSYNHLCMHMLACEVIKTIKIRTCKHKHWSLHSRFNTPPPH